MERLVHGTRWSLLLAACISAGCQSPYYADRGALFGGLTGAGVGAVVGDALGNTGAGAAIGAGVGTVTGAAVGSSLDEIDARNRAQIAAQMGRQVREGAVTIDEVISMSKAGVSDRLIVTHIQNNGAAQRLSTQDLIYLKEQGVSDAAIGALQAPPRTASAPRPSGRPVIVEERYYGPPPPVFWSYGPRPHHHYHRRPRASWGFSFSN